MRIHPFNPHKIACLLFFVLLAKGAWADVPPEDFRQLPTGLIEPSPARLAAWKRHARHIEQMQISALGLKRINAWRKTQGKTPLPLMIKNPSRLTSDAVAIATASEIGSAALADTVYPSAAMAGDLPPMVDNSTSAAFPPIGKQQGQSCVAFSSTYYLFTYATAMANGFDVKTGGANLIFSPRWTYNLTNNGRDQGCILMDVLDVLKSMGAPHMADFYDGVIPRDLAWPSDPQVWKHAAHFKALEDGDFSVADASGLVALKTWLNNGNIAIFGTSVNLWNMATIKNNSNTTLDDAYVGEYACGSQADTSPLPGSGGHEMTIVGYNDFLWIDINQNDQMEAGEIGALKIANSWGDYWNAGFVWLSYDSINMQSSVPGAPTNRRPSIDNAVVYWVSPRTAYEPTAYLELRVKLAFRNRRIQYLEWGAITDPPDQCLEGYLTLPIFGGALGLDGNDYSADPSLAPAFTLVYDASELFDPTQDRRYVAAGWYFDQIPADQMQLQSFCLTRADTSEVLGSCAQVPASINATCSYHYLDLVWPKTPTPTLTPTGTISPTVTFTPTDTAATTPTPTSTPEDAATPSPSLSATPTVTPTTTALRPRTYGHGIVAFPNPARGHMRFIFNLAAGGKTRISIYNLAGERMTEITGDLPAGVGEIKWDCGQMAPGIYLAQVKTEGQEKVRFKIAVVR